MKKLFVFLAFLFMVGIEVALPPIGHAQSIATNKQQVLLPSLARTATTVTPDQINVGWHSAHIILNISAVPGGQTLTLSINARNPATGVLYPILIGPAVSATGTNVYKIGPGLAASSNAAAADFLPQQWQVTVTHSAGGSFTYSVGAFLEE